MLNFDKWCYIDSNKEMVKPVPESDIILLKYDKKIWKSLFDKKHNNNIINIKKLQVSNIGIYSITKLQVRKNIKNIIKFSYKLYGKKKLKDLIITDTNGGNGGISIYFSQFVKKINCIEFNKDHYNIIKNNINVYKIKDKINLINGDYLDYMFKLKQDVIICDPPWGGQSYKELSNMKLQLDNIDIICIINDLIDKKLFKLFILIIPYNYDMNHFFKNIKSSNIFVNIPTKNVKIITIYNFD